MPPAPDAREPFRSDPPPEEPSLADRLLGPRGDVEPGPELDDTIAFSDPASDDAFVSAWDPELDPDEEPEPVLVPQEPLPEPERAPVPEPAREPEPEPRHETEPEPDEVSAPEVVSEPDLRSEPALESEPDVQPRPPLDPEPAPQPQPSSAPAPAPEPGTPPVVATPVDPEPAGATPGPPTGTVDGPVTPAQLTAAAGSGVVPAVAAQRRWARVTALNWRLGLIRALCAGLAVLVTVVIVPGLSITDYFPGSFLLVAVIFGLLNAIVKPVLQFLVLRFIFSTYGIVVIVINALLLWVLAESLPDLIEVRSLAALLLGGLGIGLIGTLLETILGATPPVLDRRNTEESPA